jgi:serine/threonine protein kinase
MPLSNGTRLGPYEILAPVGAGGMGEVYRARDYRLNREVAIKVLPNEISQDPVREKRFEREAQAVSALNHPNILTIHDFGNEQGIHYMVTELIQGFSLRKLIRNGPLSTKELLDVAIQIADGLGAAHERGLTHRDLKPENIMITRDNRVKILDFGLTKMDDLRGNQDAETITRLTETGVLQGTVPYMSPEQAAGNRVDFRSDQFSFGLILFEMATGKQAFHSDTPVQTLAAIIKEAPPSISSLNPVVPAPLCWLIERCLQKDPKQRYLSTIDLWQELRNLQQHFSELAFAFGPSDLRKKKGRRFKWLLASAIAFVLALLGAYLMWLFVPRNEIDLSRFRFTPFATSAQIERSPCWSPDGKSIAYAAEVDGVPQIFVRNFASPQPLQITKSETDCSHPFWSGDGNRLYFTSIAEGQPALWTVSAVGGSPDLILKNASASTVSPDGTMLAFLQNEAKQGNSFSIAISSPIGTKPRTYVEEPLAGKRFVNGVLQFSPDGKQIGFWGNPQSSKGEFLPEFWLIPLPTGKPRHVLSNLSKIQAPTDFSWMPDGRRIILGSSPNLFGTINNLVIVDVGNEKAQAITASVDYNRAPSPSPDGKRIVYESIHISYDLIQVPLDGSPVQKLVPDSEQSQSGPTWSPTGNQFAFVTYRNGRPGIWLRNTTEQWERPLVGDQNFSDRTYVLARPAFSPDGQRIVYHRWNDKGCSLWVSSVSGGSPVRVISEEWDHCCASWSPDGNWLVFLHLSTGKNELVRARIGGQPVVLNNYAGSGAYTPQWSLKGNWITYQTDQGLFLTSPEGKDSHLISPHTWLTHGWSQDGAKIYGIRQGNHRLLIASIDLLTGMETPIRDLENAPGSTLANPVLMGFSLIPHQESFATSLIQVKSDLWIVEGFSNSSP